MSDGPPDPAGAPRADPLGADQGTSRATDPPRRPGRRPRRELGLATATVVVGFAA